MALALKLSSGTKLWLIVDGTTLPVANTNRCEGKSKEDKSIRQVVEGVINCVKSFSPISRWCKSINLLIYLYGYAIVYSFFRGQLRC
ncbi:MAG: hypothetical protein N3C13_00660 [Aquificaceae bacterium]|nr:hypothetical protein [Aquificaceae bacterium]MCX8059692.1 hypothetical protein [Aquificaceae bacterium]MDW8097425.1 hypothetical protein [Aquificaceae bacterium]